MSCLVGTEQQDHLKQNTFQSDFAVSFGPCKRELLFSVQVQGWTLTLRFENFSLNLFLCHIDMYLVLCLGLFLCHITCLCFNSQTDDMIFSSRIFWQEGEFMFSAKYIKSPWLWSRKASLQHYTATPSKMLFLPYPYPKNFHLISIAHKVWVLSRCILAEFNAPLCHPFLSSVFLILASWTIILLR